MRQWYENELGWAAVPGSGRYDWSRGCASTSWTSPRRRASRHCGTAAPHLRWHCTKTRRRGTEIPRSATHRAWRRGRGCGCGCWWPRGARRNCRGCCDWLEWGSLALDLTAIGAGGSVEAPLPPGVLEGPARGAEGAGGSGAKAVRARGPPSGCGPPSRGARWNPAADSVGRGGAGGDAPDLVRLVDTVATQCHGPGCFA